MRTANPALAAEDVARALRRRAPVVQCITNTVTAGRVADALAALGAHPVMAEAEEEVGEIAGAADALLLDLGTPTAARWAAMLVAGRSASDAGRPVIVDPVGCGASSWRTAKARELVAAVRPAIVRGGPAEVAALAGIDPGGARLRGVASSGTSPPETERIARGAAAALGATVIVSGATVIVADEGRVIRREGAAALLARMIGAGDVLSAIVTACAAVETDRLHAALAGLDLFDGAAAEAARGVGGTGSFWPAFLDALGRADAG